MDAFEVDSVISSVVSELLAAAGVTEPPVDPVKVAAAVRLEVQNEGVEPDVWPPRCRAGEIVRGRLSRATGTAYVMAHEYSPRQNFAVAHEVGEWMAPRLCRHADIGESFTPQLREFLCDRLASHLLLPSQWFEHDCRRLNFDLFRLRSIYMTASHEVIARRMTDVEPCIVTIFDAGRRGMRLPHRWAPVQSIEARAQREAHETGEVARQSDEESGLTAVAWPVHDERGRKREIVRLSWPQWAA